jgi:Cu/Ag efflux protein CusF
MPPMTMVFHVKDAAALERFKVGDKINFVAKKNASGAFTAGDIQPAKP